MKKFLSLLLAVLLVASLVVGCGKGKEEPTTGTTDVTDNGEPTTDGEDGSEIPDHDENTLFVGSVEMDGFFYNGFTNSSYDVLIKKVLGNYGTFYATYATDQEGAFVLDPTTNAKDPETKTNDDGSKTYTFFLNESLVWNDGTPITAKDYVFGHLFDASQEWMKAGAGTSEGNNLLGYGAYHDGDTISFPGVKYLGEHSFEVTIDAEYIPYFYELAAVSLYPIPMHRFCPNLDLGEDGSSLVVKEGYEVTDADKDEYKERLDEQIREIEDKLKSDLEGIEADKEAYGDDYSEEEYLADKENAEAGAEKSKSEIEEMKLKVESGDFDARDILFQANCFEVAQVYRYTPDVTCGPYQFVENKNKIVTLEINPLFLGDFEGNVPTIKNIVVKTIPTDSDADLCIAGEIDLSTMIVDEGNIKKAREAAEEGILGHNSYGRLGYGQLQFLTDLGATRFKEVRKAIASLLNRDLFVQEIYGGYGAVIDGPYSDEQWMFTEVGEEFEEKATHYTLNIEKANEFLDETPFKFEADGTTPWSVETAKEKYDADADKFDYYRYTAEKEKLVVNQAGSYKPIVDLVNGQLPNYAKLVGMLYNAVEVDFPTLLANLTKPDLEKPKFTAFTMGTGFSKIYDPYYQYHSTQIGNDNRSRTNDPEADRITMAMRKLDPTETEKFAELWLEFQLWFNDNMPDLPLYSNDYYDIHTIRLEGLETTPFFDWAHSVCKLSIKN